MDAVEKLEQAAILKDKGTGCFKVSQLGDRNRMWIDL